MDESNFDRMNSNVQSIKKMMDESKNSINEQTKILNSLLSFKNNMNESSYQKIKNRVGDLMERFGKIITGILPIDNSKFKAIDHIEFLIEVDLLIKEFPVNHKVYLVDLFNILSVLKFHTDNLMESGIEPVKSEMKCLSEHMQPIIECLTEVFNPEIETQEQPKSSSTPIGHTLLNRNQTAMLVWYLREKSLIAPKTENKNIAKAIELMTGHSAGIMEDILKKPGSDVCKLGKDNKTVDKNDFDIVISELEKLIIRIKKDRTINLENGELN